MLRTEQIRHEIAIAVLDTNIVLDLFLFKDPRAAPLLEQLISGQLTWHATAHMRNELERVLTYPHIAAKLAFYQKSPADILAAFDQFAKLAPAPAVRAPYVCKDPDDQVFIDLACHLARKALATNESGQLRSNPSDLPNGKPGDHSITNQTVRLISKDKAVLSMRKRLEKLSVIVTMTHIA